MLKLNSVSCAAGGLLLSVMLAGCSPAATHLNDGEFMVDGMIFGMPEAEVFTEDYSGPPVVGDYVTALPFLKPLDYEGNRTHEVRLDMFSQVEIGRASCRERVKGEGRAGAGT